MDVDRWRKVHAQFQEGDVEGAVRDLERDLAAEPVDRFKVLIEADFSNQPSKVLSAINKFAAQCVDSFDVQAIYIEMNEFDINYDRWFFYFFGYTKYVEDPNDLDWLCDWQKLPWQEVKLTGMAAAQREFRWYHENEVYNDKSYERAYQLSQLLIMCKYVRLIQRALSTGQLQKPIPVLATAHDFDIVGRFMP